MSESDWGIPVICLNAPEKKGCPVCRNIPKKENPRLPERRRREFLINYSFRIFADYTIPCAIMALATFMNPATLAPFT